jgi:hypothetical protein
MRTNPASKVWLRDELPRCLQGAQANENEEPPAYHGSPWFGWVLLFGVVALMATGLIVDKLSAQELVHPIVRMLAWFDAEAMRFMIGHA